MSSTPRARPASRRASPSTTRASATSSRSPPRSTASGPDDRVYQGMTHRLRLLGRGALGAAGRRRDARPGQVRREPGRRRSRRLPAQAPRHRALPACRRCWRRSNRICRTCASCWSAARPARTIWSSRWHRPGRTHPQRLWPDRGDRHGNDDRLLTRTSPSPSARRCRPTRSSFSTRARTRSLAERRARRDRHRRHRRSPSAISTAHDLTSAEVHRRFPRTAEQSVEAHLSHRRPRPHQRRRRDRVSRPHRHPGQDPRLSHRARRDRGGAAGAAGDRAGGGQHLRARARRGRARRLLHAKHGAPTLSRERYRRR